MRAGHATPAETVPARSQESRAILTLILHSGREEILNIELKLPRS